MSSRLLRGVIAAGIGLVMTAALAGGGAATATAAAAPPYTITRYVSNPDAKRFYALGCEAGRNAAGSGPQSAMVILDFGQPMLWNNGTTYGTYDFGNHLDSIDTISAVVKGWLKGWWDCTPQGGPEVRLAVGTSNYKGATTYAHGREWARMVNALNVWISNNGYGSQLHARGANDMEISWNTAANTRAWVDGYNADAWFPLVDYGDAEGGVNPPNGWTAEDVWYKAYGATQNWPVPEIYYRYMATDTWQPLSLWAYRNKGKPIYFLGVLTQYAADPTSLSPSAGWSALFNALAGDKRTAQSELFYSTDITWQN